MANDVVGVWNIEQWLESRPEWRQYIDLVLGPPDREEVIQKYPEAAGSDAMMDYWTTDGIHRRAYYMFLRMKGMAHRLAELLACQSCPAIMTDSVFKAGMQTVGDDLNTGDGIYMRNVIAAAKAKGFTPSPTSTYFANLARYPGDREAFVPATEGRGYIKKLCEKRGWACDGAVKSKARQPDSDPLSGGKKLGNDIVNARMREMAAKDPDRVRKNRAEIRESIIQKHGMD
jgi:hypothetical protein